MRPHRVRPDLHYRAYPNGSGNGTYGADWFELTNAGASSVDITGWKFDDLSGAFASSVAFRGVTSIAPGQSVVFFEGNATGTTDATITTAFNTAWGTSFTFGTSIGAYGGSGVGLSTAGDAVNIFDAAGTRITGIAFGPTTLGFTFDNSAGLGSTTTPLPTVTTLSVAGVNGAFLSGLETGSPGLAAVPEPSEYAAAFGVLSVGLAAWFRRRQP